VELFPSNSNINFMRMRMVSLTIAGLLMLGAIISMMTGFNYALDFTGGTKTEMTFAKPVNVEEMRSTSREKRFSGFRSPHSGCQQRNRDSHALEQEQ